MKKWKQRTAAVLVAALVMGMTVPASAEGNGISAADGKVTIEIENVQGGGSDCNGL